MVEPGTTVLQVMQYIHALLLDNNISRHLKFLIQDWLYSVAGMREGRHADSPLLLPRTLVGCWKLSDVSCRDRESSKGVFSGVPVFVSSLESREFSARRSLSRLFLQVGICLFTITSNCFVCLLAGGSLCYACHERLEHFNRLWQNKESQVGSTPQMHVKSLQFYLIAFFIGLTQ